jgi:hypothetical protein
MPVITDPLTHRIAELGTVCYELVLHLPTRFFTHADETDEQLDVLIGTAIELMADVIRPLGTLLTKLPAGPGHGNRTAGLTFQMNYLMGNFVPWREPSWALLHERMAFLVTRCDGAREHEDAPPAVHDAGERVQVFAERLAAHVPAELRGTG